MNNLNLHSLRFKIIAYLSVIATLLLGGFQAYIYFTLENRLIEELNNIGDFEIERLVRDLDGPMWELDETAIKMVLNGELKNEQVHAIYVTGNENIAVNIDKDNSGDNHQGENYVARSLPILHQGDEIGEIRLYLTKDQMNKRLYEENIHIIIFTIIEIIVIILLLLIMLRRVILRPIESLVESTKRIADGDYRYSLLKLDDDEIGELGKSVHQMKNKIELREKELKLTKERLEYAVNGTRDGLWDWNLQTNEIYYAPRWKAMLGYTDDELPNVVESWTDRVHPDDLERAEKEVALSQDKPGRFYENVHRLRHKDGRWIWVLDRGQTIFNEEGKAVRMVGFKTDITKQKELEVELLAKEEMMLAQSRHVAMGEMIGMIAHQWRQPITVIAMGANNILADIALEEVDVDNFKDEAEQILQQTEYLSKTIDDFRTFFRPNKEKDEIRILDVFLEAKQIMGKSLENHNIELILSNSSDETILTYSRELLQVVLNLLKNSKEALEERKTENAHINVTIKSREDVIVISVCDNGGGIDENIIEHIFEPYFSTKDKKTGTGLGLYMSKTIIQKHLHGVISAENSDEGACLTVRIPKTFHGEEDE